MARGVEVAAVAGVVVVLGGEKQDAIREAADTVALYDKVKKSLPSTEMSGTARRSASLYGSVTLTVASPPTTPFAADHVPAEMRLHKAVPGTMAGTHPGFEGEGDVGHATQLTPAEEVRSISAPHDPDAEEDEPASAAVEATERRRIEVLRWVDIIVRFFALLTVRLVLIM